MELVDFLRQRLDEDEQVCHEALDLPPMVGEWRWARVSVSSTRFSPCGRHHPARVLREVQAKRRIMEIHYAREFGGYLPRICDGCGYEGVCDDPVTEDINDCPILRLLALPYADHQDYSAEWAPDVTVK